MPRARWVYILPNQSQLDILYQQLYNDILHRSVAESSDIVITILSQNNDYHADQATNLKNNILKQIKSNTVSLSA